MLGREDTCTWCWEACKRRSMFQHTCVQQWVLVLQAHKWDISPLVVVQLRDSRRGLIHNTKMIEATGVVARRKQLNQPTDKCSGLQVWLGAIKSGMLHNEHRYDRLEDWYTFQVMRTQQVASKKFSNASAKEQNSEQCHFPDILRWLVFSIPDQQFR